MFSYFYFFAAVVVAVAAVAVVKAAFNARANCKMTTKKGKVNQSECRKTASFHLFQSAVFADANIYGDKDIFVCDRYAIERASERSISNMTANQNNATKPCPFL